eukprot:scaffold2.g7279.t1
MTPEEAAKRERGNNLIAGGLLAVVSGLYYIYWRRVQERNAAAEAEELQRAAVAKQDLLLGGALLSAAGGAYYYADREQQQAASGAHAPTEEHLVNWSGTHECHVRRMWHPESLEELEAVVARAHAARQRLRCVGTGLSPNGIAFSEAGMVSLAHMDRILSIDAAARTITVQAGARVAEVAAALRERGLSLQNYASIREQTMGGFTQVSAHGSGAAIPPVDETVVAMTLVTPGVGTLRLAADAGADGALLRLARVGLGCLGVAAELTLRCVPAHRLVKRQHVRRLQQHRHLRYMWIPHTRAVAVGAEPPASGSSAGVSEAEQAAPLRDLLVNAAEAEYWRRAAGVRVGWSDELLGFDCGGQQWVLETAFPAGTLETPDGAELRYVEDLLALVEARGVAAPAPIEQRWTAGSSAPMSPAHGPPGSLHSWVGIIMYLPESPQQREAVTASFRQYAALVERELTRKYGAAEHWAKIELPSDPGKGRFPRAAAALRARVAARYPVAEFAAARRRLDPHNILGNELVDALLPRGGEQGSGGA